MAALALNTYKTVSIAVTTGVSAAYTAPSGVASIHLFSAVSNVSAGITTVTVYYNKAGTQFELVKNAKIPATDVLNPINGSLVLEVGDKIEIVGTANNQAKLILSILESAK